MAPTLIPDEPLAGLQKVRERVLTSLHLGRIGPGDRVASVRRLAEMTGINRKTVHRAYRALVREGVLDVRPGAGTFVAGGSPHAPLSQATPELLRVVGRWRGEAKTLGLTPAAFARFVRNSLDGGLGGLPVGIVECNDEQVEMIARDVHTELTVAPRPIALARLVSDPAAALGDLSAIVTTDCHRMEVERAVQGLGIRVYRVALDPGFTQKILGWARSRVVVLCAQDPRFGVSFLRFLAQLGATPEILARVCVVRPTRLRGVLRRAGSDAVLLVTPLAARAAAERLPAGTRLASAHWRVTGESLDGLRVSLAFDAALRAV